MKIYRGPRTQNFCEDSHELVSCIEPNDLKDGIIEKSHIKFNITKNAVERQSICTAIFEESDMIPMLDGLICKLKLGQEILIEIKSITSNKELSAEEKIASIKKSLTRTKL